LTHYLPHEIVQKVIQFIPKGVFMPVASYNKAGVKVADELFLTVALLHREIPDRKSFTIPEILNRAKREGLGGEREDQRSLKQHAYEHAAANIVPGQGKYKMVFREEDNTIRLLRRSDHIHPQRTGKQWPMLQDIPERYHELVSWAKRRYESDESEPPRWLDGLFRLRGLGKEIWTGVDPDEYVRSLREGWE
jgi:hypothetical protein